MRFKIRWNVYSRKIKSSGQIYIGTARVRKRFLKQKNPMLKKCLKKTMKVIQTHCLTLHEMDSFCMENCKECGKQGAFIG